MLSRAAAAANQYMTLEQAVSQYDGVFTKRFLYRLTSEGRIPHRKVRGRLIFTVADLEDYIQDGYRHTRV